MARDARLPDDEDDFDPESMIDAPDENVVVTGDDATESIEIIVRKYFAEPPRLDQYIVSRHQEISRAAVQRLIDDQRVTVNGKPTKASYRVQVDDRITMLSPSPAIAETRAGKYSAGHSSRRRRLDRSQQAGGYDRSSGSRREQLERDPHQRADVPLSEAQHCRG